MRDRIILLGITLLATFCAVAAGWGYLTTSIPLFLLLETRNDFQSVAKEFTVKGMKALAPAQIVGKSGVRHEFAFAVVPDLGKARVVIDTELSVQEVDEMKVLKFYVKVFDVGPEKAILCVSPKLESRAATLAKEYGIVVLEDDVPRKLIPMAADVIEKMVGKGS